MDILAKVDHEFSPKLRLSGEWNIENNNAQNPNFSRMGSPFSTNWDTFISTDEIGKIALTQILSPSMTNETNVSMSSMAETHLVGGITQLSQLSGFTQKLPYSGNFLQSYIPFVSFSGGWSEYGASSCCIVPNANVLYDGFADDWGWLHGKHYLEAGFTYLRGQWRKQQRQPAQQWQLLLQRLIHRQLHRRLSARRYGHLLSKCRGLPQIHAVSHCLSLY
jgi:hypothetical protein